VSAYLLFERFDILRHQREAGQQKEKASHTHHRLPPIRAARPSAVFVSRWIPEHSREPRRSICNCSRRITPRSV
jgi:hypothetical protein